MQNPFLSLHLSPAGGALAYLMPGQGVTCDYLPAPQEQGPDAEQPPQTPAQTPSDARKNAEQALLRRMLTYAEQRIAGTINLDRRGHRQGVDTAIAALGLQERFVLKGPESSEELSVHSSALAHGKAGRQRLAGTLGEQVLRLILRLDPDSQAASANVMGDDDKLSQHLQVSVNGETDAARWLALLHTAVTRLNMDGKLEGQLIETLGDHGLIHAFYAQVQTPEEAELLRAVRSLLRPHDTPMLLRAPDQDEDEGLDAQLQHTQAEMLPQAPLPEPRPPRLASQETQDNRKAQPPSKNRPPLTDAGAPQHVLNAAEHPLTAEVHEPEPQVQTTGPVVGWSFRRVPYMVGDPLTVVVGPQAQLTGTVLMSAHNVLSLQVTEETDRARKHPDVQIEGSHARVRARAVRRVHTQHDLQLREALDLLDRHPLLAQELTSALESNPDSPETRTLLRHTLLLTIWGDSDDLAASLKSAMSEIQLSVVTLQLGHAYRSPDGHLLAVLRSPTGDVMLTRLDDPTAVLEDGAMPYPEMAYDGVDLRFQLPEATPGPWLHLGRLGDLLP